MSIKIGYVGQFLFVFQQQKKIRKIKKKKIKIRKKKFLEELTMKKNQNRKQLETYKKIQYQYRLKLEQKMQTNVIIKDEF